MVNWLAAHSTAITIWCAALCTFAIYSVLYTENKFYRLFEHIFIGLGAGFGVYQTWHEVLGPKWWDQMTKSGHWYWAFAAVLGSMFYFVYSRKHVWISRVIFGMFMGLAAGGMFREFYEIYFPQMGSSMKPIVTSQVLATGNIQTIAFHIIGIVVFYVVLLASMAYFFFSFEHKSVVVSKTAAAGRWFLMIGFGAIFGATVMGRMTLLIGRLLFLFNQWVPQVAADSKSAWFWVALGLLIAAGGVMLALTIRRNKCHKPTMME